MSEYFVEYVDAQDQFGRISVEARCLTHAFHIATALLGFFPEAVYAAV